MVASLDEEGMIKSAADFKEEHEKN